LSAEYRNITGARLRFIGLPWRAGYAALAVGYLARGSALTGSGVDDIVYVPVIPPPELWLLR